ncbi:MAG TPA: zf-HC2 domain-containing protein [Steroidobacteraceae bacterium]|nr:zf-HC2 domain-containing protein [Steroidobacteraceae bacterium]
MTHELAAQRIPWLVNGTLSAAETLELEEHLADCASCRADLEEQRSVRESMRAESPVVFAGEASFQKLAARLDGGAPRRIGARISAPRRAPLRANVAVRWLAAAAVLEAVVLGYGAFVWHGAATTALPAPYVTLSSPVPSYAGTQRIRVVFAPDLTLGQLQMVLRGVQAHIIDGPTEANVYTLGFAPAAAKAGQLEARLEALRADARVRFAEPVAGGSDASP